MNARSLARSVCLRLALSDRALSWTLSVTSRSRYSGAVNSETPCCSGSKIACHHFDPISRDHHAISDPSYNSGARGRNSGGEAFPGDMTANENYTNPPLFARGRQQSPAKQPLVAAGRSHHLLAHHALDGRRAVLGLHTCGF